MRRDEAVEDVDLRVKCVENSLTLCALSARRSGLPRDDRFIEINSIDSAIGFAIGGCIAVMLVSHRQTKTPRSEIGYAIR